VRISRIQLSDHLRPAACAAGLPDGSLFPPCGTADIVHEESDSPIVSWQSPSGTDAYAEAITATRSEPPSPLYGMSSYCSPPGNRCTTHSRRGSASGSPHRLVRSTGTTVLLRARAGEYCGRPSHVDRLQRRQAGAGAATSRTDGRKSQRPAVWKKAWRKLSPSTRCAFPISFAELCVAPT
jgi:hypothetical protein